MRRIYTLLFSLLTSLGICQSSLTGHVSLDGESVLGATILLEGTTYGTSTDLDGNYLIDNIASGDYTVQVSYIGADTYKSSISFSGGEQKLDVALQMSANAVDEITVTGQRESQRMQQQAMQIESIDIEKVSTNIRDLTEAIDRLPGVRVRSSGSLGGKTDISLNGLNGTAVRTYIDGLPMEFLYPNSNLGNLPLDNVSRIDVYKGVLPIHVGTDAIGGGINVIPTYKSINRLKASYGFGSYNTHQLNVNGNYMIAENVSIYANASRNQSDNDYEMNAFVWEKSEEGKVKRFNDAYALNSIDLGTIIRNKKWIDFLRFNANYTSFDKELQHGGVVGRLAYGEAKFSGSNKSAQIDLRKSFTDKISLRNVFALADEEILYVDTTRNRYSWSGEIIANLGKGEADKSSVSTRKQFNIINRSGVELKLPANLSLNIANLYASQTLNGRDTERPIERDILQYDQVLIKNIAGAELSSRSLNDKLELAAAIKKYNYTLEAVDFRAFSPIEQSGNTTGYYATGKYKFIENAFVRASYEKAWRIPLYVQFFGNGISILPNPNLSPESSNNINLSLSYKKKIGSRNTISLDINAFERAQKDIIFLTAGEISKYQNAEEVTTRGLEMDVVANLFNNWTLNINLTKLRKEYTKIGEQNISSKFLEGTPFPNTPSLFGNIGLRYQNEALAREDDKWSIYALYKYVDEFNYINAGKIRNNENWVCTQHRLDAGWTYSMSNNKYSISFNMLNILNKELFDNYAVPRPGRSYNIKLIYNYQQF